MGENGGRHGNPDGVTLDRNAAQIRPYVLILGRSSHCYNKSIMGKKLRTRELLTDTEHDSEQEEDASPSVAASLTSSAIRQLLAARRMHHRSRTHHKFINFRRRFLDRSLGEALSSGQFECAICLELMVTPVMMQCGHAYCFRCLESNAAYSERCCLCRNDQQQLPHIPLRCAETLVERFLLPPGPELLKYLCRTTDSAEWAKRRRVANLRQGLVIDFQDKHGVWRRGVIASIAQQGQIDVRINLKGVDSFEKVEVGSRRVAPYTFFTRSRYLEDFPPCLPEHDRTQAELSKLEVRLNWQEENVFGFGEREEEVAGGEMEEGGMEEALRIFQAEMSELDQLLDF